MGRKNRKNKTPLVIFDNPTSADTEQDAAPTEPIRNFDHKSCKFTDHPIIPPEQIRFSKPRYTDYGEKSGSEAGDNPKDKDASPPTPETEPQDTIEVIDLEDPALNDESEEPVRATQDDAHLDESDEPLPDPEPIEEPTDAEILQDPVDEPVGAPLEVEATDEAGDKADEETPSDPEPLLEDVDVAVDNFNPPETLEDLPAAPDTDPPALEAGTAPDDCGPTDAASGTVEQDNPSPAPPVEEPSPVVQEAPQEARDDDFALPSKKSKKSKKKEAKPKKKGGRIAALSEKFEKKEDAPSEPEAEPEPEVQPGQDTRSEQETQPAPDLPVEAAPKALDTEKAVKLDPVVNDNVALDRVEDPLEEPEADPIQTQESAAEPSAPEDAADKEQPKSSAVDADDSALDDQNVVDMAETVPNIEAEQVADLAEDIKALDDDVLDAWDDEPLDDAPPAENPAEDVIADLNAESAQTDDINEAGGETDSSPVIEAEVNESPAEGDDHTDPIVDEATVEEVVNGGQEDTPTSNATNEPSSTTAVDEAETPGVLDVVEDDSQLGPMADGGYDNATPAGVESSAAEDESPSDTVPKEVAPIADTPDEDPMENLAEDVDPEGEKDADATVDPVEQEEVPEEPPAESAPEPGIDNVDGEAATEAAGDDAAGDPPTDGKPAEAEATEAADEIAVEDDPAEENVVEDAPAEENVVEDAPADANDDKQSGVDNETAAVAAAPGVGGAAAAVAASSSSKTGRRRHHRRESSSKHVERERRGSDTLNGHRTRLERHKEEKGIFTNQYGRAIDKARHEQERRHGSEEYKAKQKEREERREERHARHREERKARKEKEEAEIKEREEKDRKERRERRRVERMQRDADAAEAATVVSRETHRRRRPSYADSMHSGGSTRDPRPGLLRRMTTGESDTGKGKLLLMKFNEDEVGPPAADSAGSGERKQQAKDVKGKGKEKEVEIPAKSERLKSGKSDRDRRREKKYYQDVAPIVKFGRAVRGMVVG